VPATSPARVDAPTTALRPRRLGRQPALDGARGAAWLVVFVAHANLVNDAAVGQVAMFFFFALSGFLITELVLEEWVHTGSVSFRRFFARRALRLLPALYLFIFVWLAVALVFPQAQWMSSVPGGGSGGGVRWTVALQGVGAAIGYLSNWCNALGWFGGYVPLGHLWSLAVEEQFYLVWAPLLVLLLRLGRRWAAWVAATLVVASLVDVAFLHGWSPGSSWVDMGTDTRAAPFLAGGLAALAWQRRHALLGLLGGRGRPVAMAFALVAFVWAAIVLKQSPSQMQFVSAWVAVSLASPVLVLGLLGSGAGVRSFLSRPTLVYLGQRSYALYLWHYVWLTWLRSLGLAGVVGAFAASVVCAEASWRLVEARALARKTRFSSIAAPDRAPDGARDVAQDVESPPAPEPGLVLVAAG
jgi:peptidoglycan/LPS O-acetylase OafA/YrhL